MKTIMNRYTICLLSLLIVSQIYGQKSTLRQANKEFKSYSYVESAKQLLRLIEKGKDTPSILEKLATAYYYNNQMAESSKWYGELFKKIQGDYSKIDTKNYYRYAMSLKAVGSYEDSNIWMDAFSKSNPTDHRARLYQAEKDYLSHISNKSDLYELESLKLNTRYSDFGTTFYKDGIVFASARNTKEDIYKWNEQPFLDLFYGTNDSKIAKRLGGAINTRYHESSTSFTQGGDTMYFTSNNYYKGKVRKSNERVNGLKIFRALRKGQDSWGDVESLAFNSDDYSTAHPALSPDNKKLYFSSDMPGSLGQSDIYVVDIYGDGSFGEPENLGSRINTEGRENFPYVSEDNILYFSSDGRLGLGGLDVFKIDLKDANAKPENLGQPVNSSMDDFEFKLRESTGLGYVTSNRPGGKGDDDIYKIKRIECNQKVKGVVVEALTGLKLSNAQVVILTEQGLAIETLTTDSEGKFSYASDCRDGKFKATGSLLGYKTRTLEFDKEGRDDVLIELKLEHQEPAEEGEDLAVVLDLSPIYFDFDKSNIRPDAAVKLEKVRAYMAHYTDIKIDIRSHTDSRGEDAYNLRISKLRNASTKAYLIEHGIDASRVSGEGYGETQLVNRCKNGVKCTPAEHQMNRRSEFVVIGN